MSNSVFIGGVTLGLAAHLLLAATLKIRRLSAFEVAIVRLLPEGTLRHGSNPRRAAICLVALEFLAGGALLAVGSPLFPAIAGLALLLLAGFSAASIRAYRQRVPCGCFGGAHKLATRADVLRTLGLTLGAAVVAGAALAGVSVHFTAWSGVVGVAVTAAVWLPVVIARKPLQPTTVGGALDVPAGPTTRRRFLVQVAGVAAALAGLVSLGLPDVALAAFTCDYILTACENCCKKFSSGKKTQCLQCCYECYQACVTGEYSCHNIEEQYCYDCWISS